MFNITTTNSALREFYHEGFTECKADYDLGERGIRDLKLEGVPLDDYAYEMREGWKRTAIDRLRFLCLIVNQQATGKYQLVDVQGAIECLKGTA